MRHVRRQLSQALDDGTIGVTPKKSMTDFSRCVRACVCERARAPMALPHRTLPHSLSLYAALLTFIPLSAGWPAGWIAACSIAIFFAFSTIHSSQSSILCRDGMTAKKIQRAGGVPKRQLFFKSGIGVIQTQHSTLQMTFTLHIPIHIIPCRYLPSPWKKPPEHFSHSESLN